MWDVSHKTICFMYKVINLIWIQQPIVAYYIKNNFYFTILQMIRQIIHISLVYTKTNLYESIDFMIFFIYNEW